MHKKSQYIFNGSSTSAAVNVARLTLSVTCAINNIRDVSSLTTGDLAAQPELGSYRTGDWVVDGLKNFITSAQRAPLIH